MLVTFTPGSEWLMLVAFLLFWLYDRRYGIPHVY